MAYWPVLSSRIDIPKEPMRIQAEPFASQTGTNRIFFVPLPPTILHKEHSQVEKIGAGCCLY